MSAPRPRVCRLWGRQLAWTWPGRGAVRAQHAVHCSRGPARTLGFIIYIYINKCVACGVCTSFAQVTWRVLAAVHTAQSQFCWGVAPRAQEAPSRCLSEKKNRLPLKNCRRLSLGRRSRCARRGPPAAALVKKKPPAPQKLQTPFPWASQWARAQGAPHRYLGEKYFPKTPSALGRRPARSPPAPRAHARAPPPPALVEKKVEGGGGSHPCTDRTDAAMCGLNLSRS